MAALKTKDRMVHSAIALLREQGVPGVTVDAVLAHSGAPRGSVYHHFPGGRTELLLTAGQTAADYISHLLAQATRTTDPVEAVELFVAFWRTTLEQSDFRAGCPVVALATGNRDSAAAEELVRETFSTWREHLSGLLESAGRPRDLAGAEATFVIAAIEGAVVLCKGLRSPEPLAEVSETLVRWLATVRD